VDVEGFQGEMESQRQRSQASREAVDMTAGAVLGEIAAQVRGPARPPACLPAASSACLAAFWLAVQLLHAAASAGLCLASHPASTPCPPPRALLLQTGATAFTGYSDLAGQGSVVALLVGGQQVQEVTEGGWMGCVGWWMNRSRLQG
jgi:hypothetical protein